MGTSLNKFWDFTSYQEKDWFRFLCISLFVLLFLYVSLHTIKTSYSRGFSFEYTKLDQTEMQQVNKIYFDALTNHSKVDQNSNALDSNSNDASIKKVNKIPIAPNNADTISSSDSCLSCTRVSRIIQYLKTEFQDLDSVQLDSIRSYLVCSNSTEGFSFLLNSKLKVQSYFWLSGASKYVEVIFWTLFGVFCNLLFNLGVVAKSSTNNPQNTNSYFDNTEIPSQIAKVFYAPLCTLTIILGYNLLKAQNLADVDSGKGVLVFGFIGGYYSSRLLSFLDRLKDLLLPNNGTTDTPTVAQPPRKNLLIQLNTGAAQLGQDLSKALVTATSKTTGEKLNSINIAGQPSFFILDYIKPDVYLIDATLSLKEPTGEEYMLKGSEEIEVKNADTMVSITLK